MRLITRTTSRIAGRLSARRRSRFAGPVVLLLGLLVTGGRVRRARPAPRPQDERGRRATSWPRAARCSSSAAPPATARTARASPPSDGSQYGPSLVGVGAAAVDFQVGTGRMPMAQPGAQAPRKDRRSTTTRRSRQLAAYVASLGPGPAIPAEESSTTISERRPTRSIVRGGEFFRTNCTACHNFAGAGGALPQRQVRPDAERRRPRSTSTRPCSPARSRCRSSPTTCSRPRTSATIIAYLKSIEETPTYGGFALGSLGPVSEGLFAWLVGIGVLVGFAVWIAAHTARVQEEGSRRVSDDDRPARTPAHDRASRPTRSPTPGLPEHQPRPTDVDPSRREARRAPGRDALRPVDRLRAAVLRRLLRLRHRRRARRRSSGWAPPTSPSALTLGLALLFIGVGAIQWARKLMSDHEIVEMRHPVASSDEDREEALAALDAGRRGLRHRPPPADPQLAARRDGRARPAGRSSPLRDLGPLPGDKLDAHGLEEGHAGRQRRRRHPDQARRHGDRPAGQRRAGVFFEDDAEGEPDVSRAPSCRPRRPRPRSSSSGCSPTTSPRPRAARTGASTASSATPRSAPTSAARSPCGSSRRTTCSAPATSRPSTWPTTAR